MEALESVMAEHDFLKGVEPRLVAMLSEYAKDVQFKSGEFVIREGEEANWFYLIRHGSVTVELHFPPRGTVTIMTVKEGDVLGWSWLVRPYRWQFDGRAVGVVRAIALDGKRLREKCESDHDLGYELLKRFAEIMSERISATRLQLLDLYGNPRK